MSIRHEQAYNWFTNPRFKLKEDTSGRRGLFRIDRVQVVEFLQEWRRKQNVLVQQILFSQRSESLLSGGCVSVYQISIHTLLELQNILSLWWGVSKWVIEGLFLHLRLFIRENVFLFCFFCHCEAVSLISRPCCCSWALSSALSFFRSSICRIMDIQTYYYVPIGLGQQNHRSHKSAF